MGGMLPGTLPHARGGGGAGGRDWTDFLYNVMYSSAVSMCQGLKSALLMTMPRVRVFLTFSVVFSLLPGALFFFLSAKNVVGSKGFFLLSSPSSFFLFFFLLPSSSLLRWPEGGESHGTDSDGVCGCVWLGWHAGGPVRGGGGVAVGRGTENRYSTPLM